jgi:bacteriocin-like protein
MEDQMAKSNKPTKPKASADNLVKPTKKGDIELSEEDLKKVSGGMAIKAQVNL